MLGIVTGTVTKSGSGQYGPWAVISERVVKKDGGTFDQRYMCDMKEAVAEGEVVTICGTAIPKVEEYESRDGGTKHTAKVSLNFCTIVARHEPPSRETRDYTPSETFEDDIPF